MLSTKMQDARNAQINSEQYSAQFYVAISAAMEARSFRGFGLRVQASEETAHAMKLVDFVLARGGNLDLRSLQAPPKEFGGPVQLFDAVIAHERSVISAVHALFERAVRTGLRDGNRAPVVRQRADTGKGQRGSRRRASSCGRQSGRGDLVLR